MTDTAMLTARNGRPTQTAPLISVIINNYNREAFVGDAIQSVLKQTYAKVECIVVDDGSTDESHEIIRSFANIRAIFQDNAGQSGAARAGLDHATGNIVLFLDSDDFLLPDAAEMIAATWRPSIAAIHFQLRIMRGGIITEDILPDQPFLRDDILGFIRAYGYYPVAPTSGNAYAANAAREIFANAMKLDNRCFFDTWLNLCSPFLGEVVAVRRPLGVYRVHDTNVSSKKTLRLVKMQNYNLYWAQRSAARFGSWLGHEKWNFLKGPYFLKWYILTRDVPEQELSIPDYPKIACIWECCREFLTFPAIPLKKRLANCLLVLGFCALPRATRMTVLRMLYRFDV